MRYSLARNRSGLGWDGVARTCIAINKGECVLAKCRKTTRRWILIEEEGQKYHILLKANYTYVINASDDNHSLKRPHLVAKLVDLSTTPSF